MLEGKKILFFAPHFFGYEAAIKNKLEQLGATVDYYDERPSNTFITKASIRINKKLLSSKIEEYYRNILKKTLLTQYDYVFVVNIEAMLPVILKELREQQKAATFILYMWDSLQNKKKTLETILFFDHVFSFDKTDAEKIDGVKFWPLFFNDYYSGIANQKSNNMLDLCFIGTVHSDRYVLIDKIKMQANILGLKSYFFMFFHSKLLFMYKKMSDVKFYKATFKEFSFRALPHEQIIQHIRNANVVLDIQHPYQTGLTMRTIEMLGAQKKLITTNVNVKEYDFYNEQNILIIDRNNPVITKDFFETPYIKIDSSITYKYSIEGWLKHIFAENN